MSTSSIYIFEISQRNFDPLLLLWYNTDITLFFWIFMWWTIIFFSILCLLLALYYVLLKTIEQSIKRFEKKMIRLFSSRTDSICQLYEITKEDIMRHEDIYADILDLRKKEFSLLGITESLETFLPLQESIHHEINFIFQVCNKNIKLLKNKHFLYVRETMIEKSARIGKEMKQYKKMIQIFNKLIRIKNYTIIWFILPFSSKKEF